MSEAATERLQYLTNGQLREEIAYVAGADPTRYGIDSDRGLKKADMVRVATQIQPAENDLNLSEMDLGGLYETVCEWAEGDYQPNAGKPWGLNRANLKKIHRTLDAHPPREVVSP